MTRERIKRHGKMNMAVILIVGAMLIMRVIGGTSTGVEVLETNPYAGIIYSLGEIIRISESEDTRHYHNGKIIRRMKEIEEDLRKTVKRQVRQTDKSNLY